MVLHVLDIQNRREVKFDFMGRFAKPEHRWFLGRILDVSGMAPYDMGNAETLVGIKFGWLRKLLSPVEAGNAVRKVLARVTSACVHERMSLARAPEASAVAAWLWGCGDYIVQLYYCEHFINACSACARTRARVLITMYSR